jgi:hypothetical protein
MPQHLVYVGALRNPAFLGEKVFIQKDQHLDRSIQISSQSNLAHPRLPQLGLQLSHSLGNRGQLVT